MASKHRGTQITHAARPSEKPDSVKTDTTKTRSRRAANRMREISSDLWGLATKTERGFPPAAEHLNEELRAQESGTD
jgi:hypothetical protein